MAPGGDADPRRHVASGLHERSSPRCKLAGHFWDWLDGLIARSEGQREFRRVKLRKLHIGMLNAGDAPIRPSVAEKRGRLGNDPESAVPALIESITGGVVREVRGAATAALERIRSAM